MEGFLEKVTSKPNPEKEICHSDCRPGGGEGLAFSEKSRKFSKAGAKEVGSGRERRGWRGCWRQTMRGSAFTLRVRGSHRKVISRRESGQICALER